MATVYLGKHARLKKYSATTTGQKSVVRIEVEVTDHGSLGFLLEELGRIVADQKQPPKRKASPDAEPPLALSPPLKQIPHFPGD